MSTPRLSAPRATDLTAALWAERVGSAVRSRANDLVLKLLQHPAARTLTRAGFDIPLDGGPNSFFHLCAAANNMAALRLVCTARADGIEFGDCCVVDASYPDGSSFSSKTAAHEWAVTRGDPDALAVALEFEPDHPSTCCQLDAFDGATLHERALFKATMATEVGAARRFADCCRLLIAHGKPLGTRRDRMGPVDMLFASRWCRDGIQSEIVPLIGDYVRAGIVQLDAATSTGYPVAIAARSGNGFAAAAAIDLGCDVGLAASEAGVEDIVSIARGCASSDLASQASALVVEALMRRQLTNAGNAMSSVAKGRRATGPI